MGTYLRTRTLPWFLLAGVLCVVALAALHGTAQAVAFAVGVCVLLAASIRYVGLAVRDDPVRTRIVSRDGLIGGVASGIASMSAGESAGRRRRRRRPR
jgi:membrane protein implicated in regulation of membrane protease activity